MDQAVKNERLVVRQKLVDVYKEKTAPLLKRLEQRRLQFEQSVEQIKSQRPTSFFVDHCIESQHADGLLIYKDTGQVLFPVPDENTSAVESAFLGKAWHLEFIDHAYAKAANEYQRIMASDSNTLVVHQAQLAVIRCYQKAHDINKAIGLDRQLAYPGANLTHEYTGSEIMLARLKLAQLYHGHDSAKFKQKVSQLLSDLLENGSKTPLPSTVRVFVLDELLKLVKQMPDAGLPSEKIARAVLARNAESLSLATLEQFERKRLWTAWPRKRPETIDLGEPVYAMRFKVGDLNVIFLGRRSSIVSVMSSIAERLSDATVAVGVFDPQDVTVFGSHKRSDDAFLTLRPSRYLDPWKLCFFFRNASVFDTAAQKQTAIYIWAGILSTCLVFAAGVMTMRMVDAQIKMNRLKNDFLATVTHELKTPLASTRLLVDTILAGNCQNRQEEKEFLGLIAKENERLSRLIDNFLCFSRMERRKQAFNPQPTKPIDVVRAATDTVAASYQEKGYQLSLSCPETLPLIAVDSDAWVRALVNLLDNACKYSQDQRDVCLEVYAQDHPDQEIVLTPKEFGVLELMVKREGKVLTRDEILNRVWGYNGLAGHRSVDRCMATLRTKIEPEPHRPIYIHTLRDVGYKFEPPLEG